MTDLIKGHGTKVFPCYDCANIGNDVPRCYKWKTCKKYRRWLWSKGIKGFLIAIAGIIVERKNQHKTNRHKHDYSEFVSQKIVSGGMDKMITRKCSICGKYVTKNINGWNRFHAKDRSGRRFWK